MVGFRTVMGSVTGDGTLVKESISEETDETRKIESASDSESKWTGGRMTGCLFERVLDGQEELEATLCIFPQRTTVGFYV